MSEHIVSRKVYYVIFAALMVGTVLTVVAAQFDFGRILGESFRPLNDVIALTIAISKAMLVILYFMHVRYSPRLTWVAVAGGFFWLAILLILTLSDYVTRGWGAPAGPGQNF